MVINHLLTGMILQVVPPEGDFGKVSLRKIAGLILFLVTKHIGHQLGADRSRFHPTCNSQSWLKKLT